MREGRKKRETERENEGERKGEIQAESKSERGSKDRELMTFLGRCVGNELRRRSSKGR